MKSTISTVKLTGRAVVHLIKSVSSAKATSTRSAEQLHSYVAKSGHISNPYISTSLLALYANCIPAMNSARQLFDEIPQPGLVPFTAMARAYCSSNQPMKSLHLFQAMRLHGISPDSIALAVAISACHRLQAFLMAMTIHGLITKSGTDIDPFLTTELIGIYGDNGDLSCARKLFEETCEATVVVWNAIINQYIKNQLLEEGYGLFSEMPERDIVSWNTMISGLSRAGLQGEALAMFREMELTRVRPNKLTIFTVLSACARLGALGTGMWVHAYIDRNSMNSNRSLDHCLIDMYAKCGSIEKAVQLFCSGSTRRHLYSWTSAICGLAIHGRANDALDLFDRMQEAGVWPDDVTLVGVLNACAHGGLVDRASFLFRSMEDLYGLSPKVEHYGCMVDLLGRVGSLKEACEVIKEMPMEPNAVVWGAFLSACKVHKNVELGKIAAARLVELDSSDHWARVMMSNFYADECNWSGVRRVRKEMREEGTRKMPGCSSIEVNGEVHEFLAGGTLHPMDLEIRDMLGMVEAQMQVR